MTINKQSIRNGIALVVGLAGFIPCVNGQTLNVTFGDDSFAAEGRGPLNLPNRPNWEYRTGFLFRDDVSNSMWGRLGAGTTYELGTSAPGLRGGLGVSLYAVDAKNFDVGILALELALHYSPAIAPRSTLSVELGLSPEITTFNDGDDAILQNFRWAYEYIQQTHVLIGYRHMEVGIKDRDDVHIVDGWYAGVERRF